MSEFVTVAVEGSADVPVVQRILDSVGLQMGPVYGLKGKRWLDLQVPAYNHAARYALWLVLRDLDTDAACPPALISKLLPEPASGICLRIAVRATEAWLLADRDPLSQFLGISRSKIPLNPESLSHPKRTIVNLARYSRFRAIREDMVPVSGTTAHVGPGYVSHIIEFVNQLWRPTVAARQSPSLSSCIRALRNLAAR
jgi:hypothetical protein